MTPWTREAIAKALDEDDGFIRFLNISCAAWDPQAQRLTLAMPMRSELQGGAGPGHMHGGAIGALIDTAATFVVLASGAERAPTANYRVDLIRPVVDSGLAATAQLRRMGRTLAVSDVDVSDDSGRLVAMGRASFVVAA